MTVYKEIKDDFEKDANDLVKNTIQSFSIMIKELEERDALILLKDNNIQKLENHILTLKKEVEKRDQKCRTLKNDIEKLKLELSKAEDAVNNSDKVIIILSPKDVFNYSNDVIDKYIKSIKWNTISFDNIAELTGAAIENSNCEVVDELLAKIADHNLEHFNFKQFETMVMLVKEYIEKQVNANKFSLLGIYRFLKKVNELKHTELIKDFINDMYLKLVMLITSTSKSPLKDLYILEILKTTFALSLDKFTKELIDRTCNDGLLIQEELKKEDYISLLYLAAYFQKDMLLFDKLGGFDGLMEFDIPEVRCYKLYNRALQEEKFRGSAIEETSAFQRRFNTQDIIIKDKVVNYMKQNIQSLIKIDERRVQKSKTKSQANQLKPNFTECSEVCFTQNRKNRCPIHKMTFEKRIFSLKYYSDKEKTKIEGYITIGLLYCISCKKAFIDNDISEEISKKVSIKKIRMVPTRSDNDNDNEATMGLLRSNNHNQVTKKAQSSNSKNSMKVMQLDKNGVSYYPTFREKDNNKHVNKYDKKYENSLSEESDLKKLGYNIGLSREARWNILKNKAIKKLGIDKTISHISFLINLNKDKINKDYSRALGEWRYDLERLKELL